MRKKLVSIIIGTSVIVSGLYGASNTNNVDKNHAEVKNNKEAQAVEHTKLVEEEVSSGKIRGYNYEGTYTFLGVPYAKAERFNMPEEVEPWEGIRQTLMVGEIAPATYSEANKANSNESVNFTELMTPSGWNYKENEQECLNLNIWTQSVDNNAKKPVVVFFHGGGFTDGSSLGIPYYDGASLSESGDVVFVSVNHRLNVLGFLDLSAYGDEYKYSGNAGIADLVSSLKWVKENITTFGGDPENVTIMGQSGGGGKVMTLMGIPEAQGLFSKAVVQSAFPGARTKEKAQEEAAKLLEVLNLKDDQVDQLSKLSYKELFEAAVKAGCTFSPVVDGDYYPQQTFKDGKASEVCKDVSLMVGNVFAEFQDNMAPIVNGIEDKIYYKDKATEDEIKEMLISKYGDKTDAIVEAYKKAYPEKDLFDLLYINTSRNNDVAISKANQDGAPVYQYVFAWDFPIFGGVTSFHTGGDMPFFFDNIEKIGIFVAGKDQEAKKLEEETSKSIISFAYSGNPNHDGMEKWNEFTTKNGETMIFDTKSKSSSYHDAELMKLLNK